MQHNQDGPCNNYKILNDKHRNIANNNVPLTCDNSPFAYKSPDWEGHAWYRILPPAGTYIPTEPPGGTRKCGADIPGWINGFPDLNIGQTKEATVCFQGTHNVCYQKVKINITSCTDVKTQYYIYQLPNAYGGYYKYCAK